MDKVQVLVVGAGVAGQSAARALSERGVEALLVGPASADYNALLGRVGLQRVTGRSDLEGLATIARFPRTLKVHLGAGGAFEIGAAEIALLARSRLLDLIRAAPDASEWLKASVELVGRRAGEWIARVDHGDRSDMVAATHIVVATGGSSQAVGVPDAPRRVGAAVGQNFALSFETTPAHFLVQPSTSDPRSMPVSVRVVPAPVEAVGVTVTVTGWQHEINELVETGHEELSSRWPAFAAGEATSAPIIHWHYSWHDVPNLPGLYFIGAAAGLTNTFTGDGIDNAILSGHSVAQIIASNPDDPERCAFDFRTVTQRMFTSIQQSTDKAARRYHLSWRMLSDSIEARAPFFYKGRRAIFLPSGVGGAVRDSLSSDSIEWRLDSTDLLIPFLAACDEIVLSTIRTEWPFLASIASTNANAAPTTRPAALFASSALVGPRPLVAGSAYIGAAIELALLGSLALLDPTTDATPERGINWPVATAIMAGDYLLAKAASIMADTHPDLVSSFSEWLLVLTEIRANSKLSNDQVNFGGHRLFAAMLEFPARMGGHISECDVAEIRSLSMIGTLCGETFARTEEFMALRGIQNRSETSWQDLLRLRLNTTSSDRMQESSTVLAQQVRSEAARASRAALQAIRDLPPGVGRELLTLFHQDLSSPLAEDDPRGPAHDP